MATAIFKVVNEVITGLTGAITTLLTNVGGMFYAEETGLTFIGMLSVFALGTGLVFWAFKLIRKLMPSSK